MKKTFSMLLASVLLAVCLAGCGGGASSAPTSGGPGAASQPVGAGESAIVTAALTAQWGSLSPYALKSQSQLPLCNALYDTMVTYDSENNIVPKLAESWTVSDDGLVYTVKLREGVKWHDGEPFDAYDVEFSARLNADPAQPSNLVVSRTQYIAGTDASGVANGEPFGVVALDDHTVQYTLKKPINEVMLLTYHPTILPRHLLEGLDVAKIDSWEFWDAPVGCGPWVFDSTVVGTELVMTANPDYYLGKPNFDKYIIKYFAASELLAGLMSGEIDFCMGSLPLADFEMAKTLDGVTAIPMNEGQYCYMTIDLNKEYLQDVRVRRAFEMAIDKQYMLDSLYGGYGEVMASQYNSECIYIDPTIQSVYDPEAARKLLEEASWDFDRVLQCAYSAERTGVSGGAPILLQQMLGEIGVRVELYEVDYSTMMTQMMEGQPFDFSFMGGSSDVKAPLFAASQYNPDVSYQWSHLKDSEYFDILTSTLDMTNFDEICDAYQRFQKLQIEDPPYIWIASTDSLIAYNSAKIGNVEPHSSCQVPWNTWEWTVNG